MEILRIILITLGSVLGFLLLLAGLIILCRTKIEVVFGDRKLVRIHFLFLHYTIYLDKPDTPQKKKKREKKKAKAEKKKAEKEKSSAEKKAEEKKNVDEKKPSKTSERLENLSVSDIFTIIDTVIQKFIKKLYFNVLELNIDVATPEADRTAILYGQINAGIYPILGFIDASGHLGRAKINIVPDFAAQKMSFSARVVISTRVLHLLSCLLYLRKQKII